MRLSSITAFASVVGAVALLQPQAAGAAADFYKGKNVRIIVGYGAGGRGTIARPRFGARQ